jgi:hypothetical protein
MNKSFKTSQIKKTRGTISDSHYSQIHSYHLKFLPANQFSIRFKMNRIVCLSIVLFSLVSSSICEENEQKSPADELSKEEIYNINADMYCQTQLVIDKNLLPLEGPLVNTYNEILGDDIKEIDCGAILTQYVSRVHKRLIKDFKKKGAGNKTIKCFMDKIKELGYDEMRFRFNSLYGIELESKKKDVLRAEIDEEIGKAVDVGVNECWGIEEEKTKTNLTEPAEKK